MAMNAADIQQFRPNGVVDCSANHTRTLQMVFHITSTVGWSRLTPRLSLHLEGPIGSVKTVIATSVGLDFEFTSVRRLAAETMVGMEATAKCRLIHEPFEEASLSPLSLIIFDDIERLAEFVPCGDQFSFSYPIVDILLTLIKKNVSQERKLFIIATTSQPQFLETCGLYGKFDFFAKVPTLAKGNVQKVLQDMDVFADGDLEVSARAMDGYTIRKLINVGAAKSGEGQKIKLHDLLALVKF